MTLVLAASPTARRDEGRFIAARGLSVQAPATPDPWSLYLGGKRWGDLARLVGFFPIFFFFFFLSFFFTRVSVARRLSRFNDRRNRRHDGDLQEISITRCIKVSERYTRTIDLSFDEKRQSETKEAGDQFFASSLRFVFPRFFLHAGSCASTEYAAESLYHRSRGNKRGLTVLAIYCGHIFILTLIATWYRPRA